MRKTKMSCSKTETFVELFLWLQKNRFQFKIRVSKTLEGLLKGGGVYF